MGWDPAESWDEVGRGRFGVSLPASFIHAFIHSVSVEGLLCARHSLSGWRYSREQSGQEADVLGGCRHVLSFWSLFLPRSSSALGHIQVFVVKLLHVLRVLSSVAQAK